MTRRRLRTIVFFIVILSGITGAPVFPAGNAEAQNLFDLFGRLFSRPRQDSSPRPEGLAPDGERVPREDQAGPSKVFCVRLCDGAFFPLSPPQNAKPEQLCNSLCPAVTTAIYRGNQIDNAVSPRGASYSNMNNAFVYREQLVPKCNCSGSLGGTVSIDAESDPTLRPGDFVVTQTGVKKFNGSKEFPYRSSAFTPAKLDKIVPSSNGRAPVTSLRVHPRQSAAEPGPQARD